MHTHRHTHRPAALTICWWTLASATAPAPAASPAAGPASAPASRPASAPAAGEVRLGSINHLPPESPEAAKARHERVAARRAGLPILVHRGDRASAPENSLEAYAAAMDLGADGVEIDIRRSRDGVLYLHHDDELGRVWAGQGKLSRLSYYEMLAAKPKRGERAFAHTRIATLPAFLALARERAMLLHLDVKEPGLQDELIALFERADMWDHLVEVNGGNAERIRGHAKVKLKPYKGWWPEGNHAEDPDAIRDFLGKPGEMVFTVDPRPAIRHVKRSADPRPLPTWLQATWTAAGPIKE